MVVFEVGRAVNGAEAKGPCWDFKSALELSLCVGQTNSLVSRADHPRRGMLRRLTKGRKVNQTPHRQRKQQIFEQQMAFRIFKKKNCSPAECNVCLEKSTKTEHTCVQEKLASLKTSWTEGTTSLEPSTGRLSSRE